MEVIWTRRILSGLIPSMAAILAVRFDENKDDRVCGDKFK